MELRRIFVLGSFVGSILVACSSGNSFYMLDGGPEGGSVNGGSADAKADAKKRDGASADDAGEEEEDSGTSGTDASKSDTGVKTDAAKTDTGGGCTLAMSLGTAACDTCMENNCCTQANTCFNDSDCIALDDCYFNCLQTTDAATQGACVSACDSAHPNSVTKWDNAATCLQTSCSSACQ